MKRIIFSAIIIISLSAKAQQDSASRFADSVMTFTPLKEFSQFLYENTSAKQYNETFAPLLNGFLSQRYQQWLSERKKQTISNK